MALSSAVWLLLMMVIWLGKGASALDYCDGKEPVPGSWSQFAGECYFQRLLTPNGVPASVSCYKATFAPGYNGASGWMKFAWVYEGQNSDSTLNYEHIGDSSLAQINATDEFTGISFMYSVLQVYGGDYFMVNCQLNGENVAGLSGAVFCTRTQNPDHVYVENCMKQIQEEKGFDITDMVPVDQTLC